MTRYRLAFVGWLLLAVVAVVAMLPYFDAAIERYTARGQRAMAERMDESVHQDAENIPLHRRGRVMHGVVVESCESMYKARALYERRLQEERGTDLEFDYYALLEEAKRDFRRWCD